VISGTPLPVQAGDTLPFLAGRGYGGKGDENWGSANATIVFTATEDLTPEHKGTAIRFATTSNETLGRSERLRINHNGNVGIGTMEPQSAYRLRAMYRFD